MTFGNVEHVVELVQLFDHDDNLFAATGSGKCQFNKFLIFEAI